MNVEYKMPLNILIAKYIFHENYEAKLKSNTEKIEKIENVIDNNLLIQSEYVKYKKLANLCFTTFLNLSQIKEDLNEENYEKFSFIMEDLINLKNIMIISIINKLIEKEITDFSFLDKILINLPFEVISLLYDREYLMFLKYKKENIIVKENFITIILK